MSEPGPWGLHLQMASGHLDPQLFRISQNICSAVMLNTGAPQDCVFTPLRYSLHFYD